MTLSKFFLVDDNPIDLMVHKKLLNNSFPECDVTAFNNSTIALQFFADHAGDPCSLPTTLLLDIIMPQVDGFEFIERLELIFPETMPFQIFLLSSTLDDADFAKAHENKWVDTILGKPLDTDALRELLIFDKGEMTVDSEQ
jgi:CheY-like chemotaxis protein